VAFEQRSLDDYIDVAQRIADFRERHPEGTLQAHEPWRLVQAEGFEKDGTLIHQTFVVYVAAAYRAPDDERPGIGVAWEVFPGRTPYTRGSELMNAETSAWGRAIIAVGASDSKRGIASQEEVRNRQAERDDGLPVNRDGSLSLSQLTDEQRVQAGAMSKADLKAHNKLRKGDEAKTAAGIERYDQPPPGETAWQNHPAGVPALQRTLMFLSMEFSRLGINDRADKLQACSDRVGRKLASTKELSEEEARMILASVKELPTPEEVTADAQP
jgi:hypothetical protein